VTRDPVSWLLIEQGWAVVDASGERLGRVEEVLGDLERDIFDGLAVSSGWLESPRYVPAERVAGIYERRVVLDLTAGEFRELSEYRTASPVERILP
jgi:hypothetical protein